MACQGGNPTSPSASEFYNCTQYSIDECDKNKWKGCFWGPIPSPGASCNHKQDRESCNTTIGCEWKEDSASISIESIPICKNSQNKVVDDSYCSGVPQIACGSKMTNGICGSFINSCSAGVFQDIADTTSQSKRNCLGQDGGASKTCFTCKAGYSLQNGVCTKPLKVFLRVSSPEWLENCFMQMQHRRDGGLLTLPSYEQINFNLQIDHSQFDRYLFDMTNILKRGDILRIGQITCSVKHNTSRIYVFEPTSALEVPISTNPDLMTQNIDISRTHLP